MKILCFGSIITILNYAKLPAVNMNTMVTALFKAFNADVQSDTDIGHIKAGSNNHYSFTDVTKTSFDEVNEAVSSFVSRHITASSRNAVIIAIKTIIREDTTISNNDVIGYQNQNSYIKSELLSRTTFNFAEFLTNVVYYAAARNNNNKKQDAVKELTQEFFKSCFSGEKITIIDEYRGSTTALSSTIKNNSFKNVFTEVVSGANLEIDYPNTIKTFHLNLGNNKFSYSDIKNFIKDNLSNYIFSRATVNAYNSPERLAIDAFLELTKKSADKNRFSEIMLYSFLEHSLNAPKLMSKIEIENKSSNSTGIHFLAKENGTEISHQLIFGSSDTLNDINAAIDSVFSQIALIDDNSDNEVKLVDNIIFEKPFDEGTYQYLTATILPNEKNSHSRPETSYSAFIGYTIKVEGTFKNRYEYLTALQRQIKKDITDVLPYIKAKITELNLQNHSFYLYFLPLNDAEKDKDDIMKF